MSVESPSFRGLPNSLDEQCPPRQATRARGPRDRSVGGMSARCRYQAGPYIHAPVDPIAVPIARRADPPDARVGARPDRQPCVTTLRPVAIKTWTVPGWEFCTSERGLGLRGPSGSRPIAGSALGGGDLVTGT